MSVKAIPDNYSNVIPFFNCTNADKVIDFAVNTLDAKIMDIHKDESGKIMHAAILVRDSAIMLAEASEKFPAHETMIYFYVENVDEVYKKGIAAGGASLQEPADQFYGDRVCGLKDSSGNQWWIATHIKDMPAEEHSK